MPTTICRCHCKMCRIAGTRHCHAPGCTAPRGGLTRTNDSGRPDEPAIRTALGRLKAEAGSHSPSVAQIERALPGLVQVDACFLSNPYATEEVMKRLRTIPDGALERMMAHYPSQAASVAATLGPQLGLRPEQVVLANGACEVIHALLADRPGPLLVTLPTFSAYYEFASGPVLTNRLDERQDFRLDLDALEVMIERHRPETVVIINPNNPDGGLLAHPALVAFLHRVHDRVAQIIVDESFSHFTTEGTPDTVADLVDELPHLVVVNSLSKSYGIAGLRLGYAVMRSERARALRATSLWNLNAFAEWFCGLLGEPDFRGDYEQARRRYVRDTRHLFAELAGLSGVTFFPSAANFALLRLDRPAAEVTGPLLAQHGVYVRDCADKRGLVDGDHVIRVAARTAAENHRIVDGLRSVLSRRAA